ncbi:hypothetical protein OG866_44405 [Streptomyces sp. NBC_00663]|uniref:hypothetical protein n=1 Tax=Streptomyces sp. NBC_00663 TaxID=2975801 RepID=UPI002E3361A7|nr:hypothetical protein [Streptomyces sp. NBC_00663]
MDAVLETYDATGFALWPVAELPSNHLLTLSSRLSVREIGTAMAVLTSYNKSDDEARPSDPQDSMEQVSQLLTTDQVIAPGGIRIQDTSTGMTAPPGCCFGLENWRDWLEFMNGEEPWLGHDPTPRIEHTGTTVQLWLDAKHPNGVPIELSLPRLPELLGSVQADLIAFLASVGEWATRYAPPLADALVAKLDEDLTIEAPLRDGQS